ncbi:tRNA synthetase class I family protein [Raphanus sativus]|nr:tRNA synthetase class I family protein [Raphanus sativus]
MAVRLYLINSPIVRAEPHASKKEGALWCYPCSECKEAEIEGFGPFVPTDLATLRSSNVLDQWIHSATQKSCLFCPPEMMDGSGLYCAPHFLQSDDPFTPFFTETLYRICGKYVKVLRKASILQFSGSGQKREWRGGLSKVLPRMMTALILLGTFYVLEELNVRSLVICNDTLKYASLKAEPDFSVLGKRLGKSMGLVAKQVKENVSAKIFLRFEEAGKVTIDGHTLELTDIKVSDLILYLSGLFKRPDGLKDTEIDANGDGTGDVLVLLDLRPDDSLYEAGVAREMSIGPKTEKEVRSEPTDFVEVYIEPLEKDESALQQVVSSQEQYIKETIGSSLLPSTLMPSHAVSRHHHRHTPCTPALISQKRNE